ncbi:MAG: nodulation protein NfeD [Oligoflexales bacterium]|nr:nodulation protein NfeD [Oligoflexales bacterium]
MRLTLTAMLLLFFALPFTNREAFSLDEMKDQKVSWLKVSIGIIGTASDDILFEAISEVKNKGYSGLLVILDTPGGSLDSTRSMVQNIMKAPFPVVVWVGPGGARAGSAGAFITLSAHIASMAPGTNIGAAHPIEATGKDIEKGEAKRKVENDTAAFMESIAETRGRNTEMAVSFVINSLSVTSSEALENKVIDLISPNVETLFSQINNREVTLEGGKKTTIRTTGASVIEFQKSMRHQFLEILSNPNLFYLLFIVGIIGIGFELTHPGVVFPGVIGGICMVLALIATSVLPINFGGLVLILISIAFMVGEIFLPSFGVLGIGGFIAFIIGSLLLIDPKNELGLRLSLSVILPGALTIAGFGALIGYLVLRSARSKVVSGVEGMVGLKGHVLNDFENGTGKVRITGEIWKARADGGSALRKGDQIVVSGINGLELSVKSSEDHKPGEP